MADEDTKKALLQPEEKVEVSDSEKKTSNDPSDNLTPEHPRFKEVLTQLRELKTEKESWSTEKQDLLDRLDNLEKQSSRGTVKEEDQLTLEEEAALNKIDKSLRNKGFLTKEQLDERDRVFNRKLTLDKLQEKYAGGNKYPKFNSEEVLEYSKRNGFGDNLEAAYFDMHREAIIKVEAEKLAGGKEVPQSEAPANGEVRIPQTELTAQDVSKMSDAEWEAKRGEILTGIKSAAK